MAGSAGYTLDPGLKGLLASLGVSAELVLRRAGLPEDLMNRPGVRVQRDQYYAFARAMEEVVDDPLFPVRLAQGLSAEWFSPPIFAALCSPDLSIAATRLQRFKPLVCPMRLEVERGEWGLRVSYDWLEGPVESPPNYLVAVEALALVKLARMGTREDIHPTSVTVTKMPEAREAFEAFLGCELTLSEATAVSFSADDAVRPFLTHNSAMWDIFEPQLRKRLADVAGSASFEDRTRAVLIESLPSGGVSVDVVARRLAVSARTLQRRLREEGTSFKGVVRELRESLARNYLGQTRLSASEIAYLLGFEETASFFRAFHRWTGTTPEAMRQSLQRAG